MFTRPFHPARFLASVYGTEPFLDYCRQRQVLFAQTLGQSPQEEDCRRWAAALAELPHEQHAQVELELATVNEMAGPEGVTHLMEAAGEGKIPPTSIPSGAPLVLWYFQNRPLLFREVFLRHEIAEVASWRTAKAPPGRELSNLEEKAAALGEGLKAFFQMREGTGRYCTVDAHGLTDATSFVVQVADRLQFLDVFTESGRTVRQKLRPAIPVLFVYSPRDGTVLLKSHLRARGRIAELFQCFGKTVLGGPVAYDEDAFDLDVLKRPFHPLPNAQDMDTVRVKTLHLHYPKDDGGRLVKLETHSGDDPSAVARLLQAHVNGEGQLSALQVCHAELQVKLRIDGRSKSHVIRLWRSRSNLTKTPLGDRFRSCLQHWGLTHAEP